MLLLDALACVTDLGASFAVQGLPLWRANSTALHIAVGNRDLQAVGLLLREYVSPWAAHFLCHAQRRVA